MTTVGSEPHVMRQEVGFNGARYVRCTCGAESFPIRDGYTWREVAASHAVAGVLLPAPGWGRAREV